MLNELIWNGELNCGREELAELLRHSCHEFTVSILDTVRFSPCTESKKLISHQCIERVEGIASILADIIQNGSYYTYEDQKSDSQNASKLTGWVLLGSLTETILQMFLAFYIEDYKNTKWKQWEELETEKVTKPIFEVVQKLIEEGLIDSKQGKSIKDAVKNKIKEHTQEHPVDKVMLDELIQLYDYLDLMNEDEIKNLRQIQSNRNGIHSFQNREIGNWKDLQYSVRFFCYLLEWVTFHLPDIPDIPD